MFFEKPQELGDKDLIEVEFALGTYAVAAAGAWDWEQDDDHQIVAYRAVPDGDWVSAKRAGVAKLCV